MRDRQGGIIGATVTPTQSSASGVWTLREAERFNRGGIWPARPGAPTSLAGTGGNAQVALTWTAPTSNGGSAITGYVVEYTPSGGSASTVSTGSTSASYTVTGLTNGTAYTFRVAAVNAVGTGSYSTASGSVTPSSFTPTAVMLTSGISYTVPTGATTMKAWAIGQGGAPVNPFQAGGGAGGTAYKTWSVTGGATVAYTVGKYKWAVSQSSGGFPSTYTGASSTVSLSGTTIIGLGGQGGGSGKGAGGGYSGGDGGANGGSGGHSDSGSWGGAIGGIASYASCGKPLMTDISGLAAALALIGTATVGCGSLAGADDASNQIPNTVFGSGSYATATKTAYGGSSLQPGYGGGGCWDYGGLSTPPSGAVVLLFS